MKNNKLNEFLTSLINDSGNAINELNEALDFARQKGLDARIKSIAYDGTIKRFENLFTKTINLLRFALSQEGIETASPRQVVTEAVRLSWIKDANYWMMALDARTSSINKISDISHNEYLNIASQFSNEAEVIVSLLGELRKN
jgi:hypothetical protein